MSKNYNPKFTYHDFVHDFTGELFNASEWAQLFQDVGAKYVILTAKHHDGYTLWPSTYSFAWNSKDMGPKIDVLDELSSALRSETNLKFGLHYSLYEWFNPMYAEDKRNSFTTNHFVTKKIMPELKEMVTKYKPDIFWSNGDQEAPASYWQSEELALWLYNTSPVNGTIIINDKWGKNPRNKIGDYHSTAHQQCGNFTGKWENAVTIDTSSWCHRGDSKLKNFMTSKQVIDQLVTTVSCGGNFLINLGPTKYGTIEAIFEERLRDMGKWLKINGEAIYSTKPWNVTTDSVAKGVRYTTKYNETDGRTNIYAIILDYPYDNNQVELFSVAESVDCSIKVSILGLGDTRVDWNRYDDKLRVTLPAKYVMDRAGLDFAWTIKIGVIKP